MKIYLISFLALTSILLIVVADNEKVPLIVGGSNAIPGEFSFMVSMQWFFLGTSAHFCGGSIIGPVWILTVRRI